MPDTPMWNVDVWSDRQWTCIKLNDGVTQATLSLTHAEAVELALKLLGRDAEQLETTGKMLGRYVDDCFPPPNDMGQVHFGRAVMDCAATNILSLFYPLRELCTHRWDEQAGCCINCDAHIEDRERLEVLGKLDFSLRDHAALPSGDSPDD